MGCHFDLKLKSRLFALDRHVSWRISRNKGELVEDHKFYTSHDLGEPGMEDMSTRLLGNCLGTFPIVLTQGRF